MKKLNLFLVISVFLTNIGIAQTQWIIKHDSSSIGWPLVQYHLSFNNKVYLVSVPSGLSNYYIYEYDPVSNIYIQKSVVSTDVTEAGEAVSFNINNKMYSTNLIHGTYMYDPTTDNWQTKDGSNSIMTILNNLYPPSSYGIVYNGSLFAFSINNIGYIGGLTILDLSTNSQQIAPYIFTYDPSIDAYNVITVPPLMTDYNILEPATFVIYNKGYIAGTLTDPVTMSGGSGIFEFDPSGNTFINKTFYTPTGGSYGEIRKASFVLNNKAYLNLNFSFANCQQNISVITYDPLTDSWANSDSIVVDSSNVYLGFESNNKGYFGYGQTFSGMLCQTVQLHTKLFEYTLVVSNNETKLINNLEIYPNPAHDQLTVIARSQSSITDLSIMDMMGKVRLQERFSHVIPNDSEESQTLRFTQRDKVIVNVKSLPAGLYIIKVTGDKGTEVTKFIKE